MSAVAKDWLPTELNEDEVRGFCETTGIESRIARLLVARGIHDEAHAERFLNPKISHLPDPSTMKDLDRAAVRVADAILAGEKVALYGDYDVDGVTSSSLLASFLDGHGVQARVYIPKRLTEGYGLNEEAVNTLASEGTQLLITLDCGITAADEVARANERGIQTIVVDHHKCPPELPPAFATLNPQQEDCDYPDTSLAAVGVCFNLVVGIRRELRERGYYERGDTCDEPNLRRSLDLVALGTIADMVPLTGVNRVLTWHGIRELRAARRPGVRALMEVSKVRARRMSSSDVGFRLGPRINAAGRLDDASVGVQMLLADDVKIARKHAATLDVANRNRQRIERRVFEAAAAKVDAWSELPPAIVLYDETWHPGVIGICASKLVERYARPVVLIGEGGKGSARTAGRFHLYDALRDVSEHLLKFGGHRAAAGMTLHAGKYETFKKAFLERVRADLEGIEGASILVYDEELEANDVEARFVSDLEKLEPFGMGNPEPLFKVSRVRVRSSKIVGNGHLKLRFEEGPPGGLEAIAFQRADLLEEVTPGRDFEVAFHVDKQEFNGVEYLGIRVRDMRPSASLD